MSTSQVVRQEHGPASGRGRIAEVTEGPYTRVVLRDDAGRIIGLEGRSRLDDVVEAVSDIAEDTDDLGERVKTLEAKAAAKAVARAVERSESRITERIDQHADGLSRRADELREAAWRIEGWKCCGDVWMHPERVGEAGKRLGVSWPVVVDWMTRDDEARTDGCYDSGYVGAYLTIYRGTLSAAKHVIKLREHLPPDETARHLRHELAHAAQLEQTIRDEIAASPARSRSGKAFGKMLANPEKRQALEREADQMGDTVADLELVRAA